jgi:hypothetical protein
MWTVEKLRMEKIRRVSYCMLDQMFVIANLHNWERHNSNNQVKEGETNRECSICGGRKKMGAVFWWKSQKEGKM